MRAKFLTQSITLLASGNTLVTLEPVIAKADENKAFWQATPSGKLEMCITNPQARVFFEPGVEYYIDFTRVSDD